MHKFGGRWTEAKLSALHDYLEGYTTALKNKNFKLHYVDAFAGSGTFVPTGGDAVEKTGSAQIALRTPGFHRYHFIEKRSRRCESLRLLAERHAPAAVNVLEGDANQHLSDLCRATNWRNSRAVLFLDPYGMQVEWKTLEQVAATGSIDVWYLFPLSGITRQLTRQEPKMDDSKRRSLDRVLGTPAWREAFYQEAPPDLFGDTLVERHADSPAIIQWVSDRLGEVFPRVIGPVVLRKGSRGNLNAGPPLFALYCLISSHSPRAQKVASDIANGVIKKLRREAAIDGS